MQKILLTCAVYLLIAGCGNVVYKPVTVKPQFFEKKGDWEASINTAGMTEFHGAYAFHDKFSAGLTYSSARRTDTINSPDSMKPIGIGRNRDKDFEINSTYFKKIGESGVFELQYGIGFTRKSYQTFNLNKSETSFSAASPYTRFFLQPAFGLNNQIFDIGIAARMQLIKYPNATDFLVEPTLFTRFGYKNVKAMFQLGLLAASKQGNYDYWPLNIGFGLYFQMNNSTKAKQK